MSLALRNVDKIVGGETHLKGIDLEFETGSRNVFLGRTLAGKTSLLRIMAGLDRPTRGQVLVDGVDVTGVSVRKRGIAMVYQQIFWYTAFLPSMVEPGPTVNEDGTPKWRMAPSPHGPYWEEGMKLGYQDCGSWTFT